MQTIYRLFRNPVVYIVILLIITGVFIYSRSVNRTLHSDEVLYSYVLDTDTLGGYWRQDGVSEKLTTFRQVVSSQINHYQYANGRTIAHTIEQVFTGIIGLNIFYVLNAVMFAAMIWLTLKLNVPRYAMRNYLLWFMTIIIFMYMFPEPYRLWYSVNISPNYQLPCFLLIVVFLFFNKIKDNLPVKNSTKALIILICLLFGWSHEGFSAPVGASFFIYYLFNLKDFKKNGWWFCASLWLGCLLIVLSPGALGRASIQVSYWDKNSIIDELILIYTNLSNRKTLILLFIILIFGKISKRLSISEFIKSNGIYFLTIVISFIVLQTLRPEDRAFTIIDLISAFLVLQIVSRMSWTTHNSMVQIILSAVLSFIFLLHQISICKDSYNVHLADERLINEYISSEDSIFLYELPPIKWYNIPYVSTLLNGRRIHEWVIQKSFGNWVKPIRVYNTIEYSFMMRDGFQGIKGPVSTDVSAFIHTGDNYFWADADSIPNNSKIQVEYEPLNFGTNIILPLKIKFALFGSQYPKYEYLEPDTFRTPRHTYYRITPPGVRRIKTITVKSK